MTTAYFFKTRMTAWLTFVVMLLPPAAGIMGQNPEARADMVDRIVAVVNEDIITLSEFDEFFAPHAQKIKAYGYMSEEERQMLFKLRETIINQMIDKKLTDQEIRRLSLTVSDAELNNAIEKIKEKNLMTDEDLRARLNAEGLTMEGYRTEMREQIQRAKLVEREVKAKIIITDEDLREYYEKNMEEFSEDTRYHLRNIIMKTSSYAGERDKQAVMDKMTMVMERLNKGESFESLALIYSESTFAADGGDLGLINKKDLTPQIQKALDKITPGRYTEILNTEQGLQIFYLEEALSSQSKSLEEVRSRIEEKLYSQMLDKRFKEWVTDLRKEAYIKIIN